MLTSQPQMPKLSSMLSTGALVILVAFSAIFGIGGLTSIEPGEVGLKIKMVGSDSGMQKDTMDTGLHWVNPITHDVAVYDGRSKQYEDYLSDMPSQTKDGQPVLVDLSVELSLVDSKVPNLHESVGSHYYDEVVYPAIRSAIRNTTTQQMSDTIYTGIGRMEVQNALQETLSSKLEPIGIRIAVNLRAIEFTNRDFIATLEQKAGASQKVIIEERNAEAAEQTAIKMANMAEGNKQKRIKAAQADRMERKLRGEGSRLEKEEEAKGLLAMATAKAEGTRLQVLAYGSGTTYASVKWAENMGPNVKVYGFPTGAPGTSSIMDLNGMMKGAFSGVSAAK